MSFSVDFFNPGDPDVACRRSPQHFWGIGFMQRKSLDVDQRDEIGVEILGERLKVRADPAMILQPFHNAIGIDDFHVVEFHSTSHPVDQVAFER